MNNSDLYPALTDNNPFRICCLIVNVVSMLVGLPFMFGIVWFEKFGSDKKRTILNMFVSQLISIVCLLVFIVQIPELLRYTYGPLPPSFCFLHLLLRNYLSDSVEIIFNSISISRFVYIFCLNNPAAFQDDFWFRFSSLAIHLFSQLFWSTLHLINTNQPVIYYICTGEDSEEAIKHPFKGYGITDVISIILNVFIYIKIYFYKQKLRQQSHPQLSSSKTLSLLEIEKENLANFFFVVFSLTFLITTTITVSKLNSVHSKDFNLFPNYLFAYYRSLIFPSFSILFFIIWFYAKKNLRDQVFGQFKIVFSRSN